MAEFKFGSANSLTCREERLAKLKVTLKDYHYVRFTFVDLEGRPRTKLVPARNAYSFMEDGIPFYCGMGACAADDCLIMMQDLEDMGYGNVKMMADLDTLHIIPWVGGNKYRTAEVYVEPGDHCEGSKKIQSASARFAARKQLQDLEDLGYLLKSGMEWEYFLLEGATGEPVFKPVNFHSPMLLTEFEHWFVDIDQYLWKAGVNILTMQTEYGNGQFEFCSAPEFGIQSADGNVLMKDCMKEVALQKGWKATFMAKTSENTVGSGAHFSFSLWDKHKNNAFLDESDPENLSATARYWIAGIMKHAAALSALCCPTTNCYQRLRTEMVPDKADWGIDDRYCLLRVKNQGVNGTYMENRLPSPLANPYLVMAGVIAAGMDGIKNKLKCPEQRGSGEEGRSLPYSLQEALDSLEKDGVMVEALGHTLVQWILKIREGDLKALEGVAEGRERYEMERKRYGYTG